MYVFVPVQMNAFLESMAGQCDICTVRTIGQSYEGRDMKLIQVYMYMQTLNVYGSW